MRNIMLAIIFLICGQMLPAKESQGLGIVSFSKCTMDSKYGKQEQEQMEITKKQWSSLLEQTQKEITELGTKFEDQDYLDTLSPEAEEELRFRYKNLHEDLAKYQNQSMRELNQANYFLYYKLAADVSKAAEKIATEKKLNMILNKDACFYIRPDMDITEEVITEMNKNFDKEQKTISQSEPKAQDQ